MVRARRKAQGLRQDSMASSTGMGRPYIVDTENGKPAVMIARFLGIMPMVEHALSGPQDRDLPDMMPEDPSNEIPEDLPDDLPLLKD